MFTDNKKFLPFPEAIERDDVPDRFEVSVGLESRTDLAHGIMVINGGDVCSCGKDHARATRLHEMGHVAWTPADWVKRVERSKDAPPPMMVNACEDARLTRLRQSHRLEASPPILCEAAGQARNAVMGAVQSGNIMALAGTLAAAVGSADIQPLREEVANTIAEMKAKGMDEEARVMSRIEKAVMAAASKNLWDKRKPSFRSSIAMAREVMDALAVIEQEYLEAKDVKEASKKTVVKEVKTKGKSPDSTWGTMSIVEVPLTKHSSLGMERKWTARDEGPIPTRFDRWSIDKRVFRAKKRVKGAAILVDCSSSMHWTEEDLRRVLEEVPAATVAIYSGKGEGGKLVIVARKGRRAQWAVVKPHKMGGNVIDGPALAWLADQPESVKVWMSDGGITGPNDRHSGVEHIANMERDVKRHLRRGGIMRVRDVDSVMKVLAGKQKFIADRDFQNPWG